jgi:hypothetical protein
MLLFAYSCVVWLVVEFISNNPKPSNCKPLSSFVTLEAICPKNLKKTLLAMGEKDQVYST